MATFQASAHTSWLRLQKDSFSYLLLCQRLSGKRWLPVTKSLASSKLGFEPAQSTIQLQTLYPLLLTKID